MVPIYFPHTYISESVIAAVQTFFRPLAIYLPFRRGMSSAMQAWERAGLVELRTPPHEEGGRFARIIKEYRDWAALHAGEGRQSLGHYRTRTDKVPFYDETSVSRIRDDIRGAATPAGSAAASRFDNARIFLGIAQEMDAEADSLSKDLQRHAESEQRLFRELSGDAEPVPSAVAPGSSGSGPPPAGPDYMIAERLSAWWELAAGIRVQAGDEFSGIFVSTSRAAVDQLLDGSNDAVTLFTTGSVPVPRGDSSAIEAWRHELLDRLQLAVQADDPRGATAGIERPPAPVQDTAGPRFGLTIFLFPGMSPEALFHRAAGRTTDRSKDPSAAARLNNTVAALVEM